MTFICWVKNTAKNNGSRSHTKKQSRVSGDLNGATFQESNWSFGKSNGHNCGWLPDRKPQRWPLSTPTMRLHIPFRGLSVIVGVCVCVLDHGVPDTRCLMASSALHLWSLKTSRPTLAVTLWQSNARSGQSAVIQTQTLMCAPADAHTPSTLCNAATGP